ERTRPRVVATRPSSQVATQDARSHLSRPPRLLGDEQIHGQHQNTRKSRRRRARSTPPGEVVYENAARFQGHSCATTGPPRKRHGRRGRCPGLAALTIAFVNSATG